MAFPAAQRGPFPASRCHTFQTAYRSWFWTQYLWDRAISEPVRQTPLFLYDLSVFGATDSAEIHVENIHGPILLFSGKDDQIWPGDMMADKLMARLKQHGHAYHDVHLSYDQVRRHRYLANTCRPPAISAD